MKREYVATIALILMCVGTGLNTKYVQHTSRELCTYVDASREAYESEEYTAAEDELKRAIDLWLDPSSYIYISLRHTEIDALTDSFYDVLSHVYGRSEECIGGYENLITGIQRIAYIETPSLGSIF